MYVKICTIGVTYPNKLKETVQKIKTQCTFKALQWNITGIKDNGLGQQNFLGTGHEHKRFYDIGHRISDIEPKKIILFRVLIKNIAGRSVRSSLLPYIVFGVAILRLVTCEA